MSTAEKTFYALANSPQIKEKSIKVIQYYSQFLKGYYEATDVAKSKRFLKTQGVLAAGRKAIRWMRYISHLEDLKKRLNI